MSDSQAPLGPTFTPRQWALRLAQACAVALFFCVPISLAASNLLMAVLVVLWLLAAGVRGRVVQLWRHPVARSALLLYLIVLLGSSYSSAPWADVQLHWSKYFKLVVCALMITLLPDPRWWRRCLQAFAAAMLFILVSTYLNLWLVLPWSASQTPGWGLSHHVFGDYITQNVMMAFFVLLLLAAGMESPRRAVRWVCWTVALLAAFSITHLSQGRTGYVLLLVAVVSFCLWSLPKQRAWLLIPIVVVVLAAMSTSDQVRQRVVQAWIEQGASDADAQTSIGHRLYNYQTSFELIREKPLLGWGTGAYHSKTCEVVDESTPCAIYRWHPHNQFVFLAVNHGALGVAALLLLMASLAWRARRLPVGMARSGTYGLLAILVVDSLLNSPLWSARESHFFVVMLALFAAGSQMADTRSQPIR